ncbi:uncharacterized protein LOC130900765 [Diorhabda carinulata]|uniref:uncharacterized protein LOC130900765 n=1 Tax=Diorhabda carinulata TaxID=1163345 RepID=UPI0025A1D781|nr:uncharacterized protein LOC130900765 [Diorhabda carinulata]
MLHFTTTLTLLIFNELISLALALPHNKGTGEVIMAKNGVQAEPTCEELKAMWRFSKRQSRAAEITNEIPMYRDPFRDNVWTPYFATSRSIGGQKIGRYRNQPIFGTIVHNPPYMRKQNSAERYKAFEEVARLYGMPVAAEPRRKVTTFRLPGGGRIRTVGIPPVQGSFQHLKELIKTERARELEQQRASEEAAARAAALKDMTKGKPRLHSYLDGYEYLSDEANYEPSEFNTPKPGLLSFPDPLAPTARHMNFRMTPDYAYTRSGGRFKTYKPTLFDAPFPDGYSGYLP